MIIGELEEEWLEERTSVQMEVGQLSVVVLDQRHSGSHCILDDVIITDSTLVMHSLPNPGLLGDSVPTVMVPGEWVESSDIVPSCAKLSCSIADKSTDIRAHKRDSRHVHSHDSGD